MPSERGMSPITALVPRVESALAPRAFGAELARMSEKIEHDRIERARAEGITLDELARREERANDERERASRAAWLRSQRLQRIRPYASQIRRPMVEAILDGTIEATPAVVAVRSFCEDSVELPFLVLSGGVGTGKTVAALAELVRRDPSEVAYVHATELARRYEPWREDRERGVEAIDLGVRLLVLDDLGTERGDDPRFAEALGRIIDKRLGPGVTASGELYRRVTIITTNLAPKEIGPKYAAIGGRIADRFRGDARSVLLTGDSMRGAR